MSERRDEDLPTDDGPLSDGLSEGPETKWRQVAQRWFDVGADEELTTAIVYAVAEAKGVAPLDLEAPPLYESVDASALEATFFGQNVSEQDRQGVGTVEVRYAGYLVTIRSDGWIRVAEPVEPPLS